MEGEGVKNLPKMLYVIYEQPLVKDARFIHFEGFFGGMDEVKYFLI